MNGAVGSETVRQPASLFAKMPTRKHVVSSKGAHLRCFFSCTKSVFLHSPANHVTNFRGQPGAAVF